MTRVVVPVRYPLGRRSLATLERAIEEAREREAELTILHVNLYQSGQSVTRSELKSAVERQFGRLERARYVVQTGFLIEESILDEVAAADADVVVLGARQVTRWRSLLTRLTGNPNIVDFLREHLNCEVITVDRGTG